MQTESAFRRPVRTLPPDVARKIAAGEVIDRPAAIVRELLDNAVDSGATRISVEIAGGGIEKIRVADNGTGMSRDDLASCARPHATSKITSADDLMRLSTLGFRGEALASIAACARLSVASGTYRMRASLTEDHLIEEIPPVQNGQGTIVMSEGLFENFPARRVFLKRASSETMLCRELFVEKALPRPDIAFRLTVDGAVRSDLPAGVSLAERFTRALELKEAPSLFYELKAHSADWKIRLVIGEPSVRRNDRKQLFIYVNGRRVSEYSLLQAIEYGSQGFFPNGTHPIGALFVEINPALVDFNIHPAKREVRFKDSADLHHGVSTTVRDFFRAYGIQGARRDAPDDADAQQELAYRDGVRTESAPAAHGRDCATEAKAAQSLAALALGADGGTKDEYGGRSVHGKQSGRYGRNAPAVDEDDSDIGANSKMFAGVCRADATSRTDAYRVADDTNDEYSDRSAYGEQSRRYDRNTHARDDGGSGANSRIFADNSRADAASDGNYSAALASGFPAAFRNSGASFSPRTAPAAQASSSARATDAAPAPRAVYEISERSAAVAEPAPLSSFGASPADAAPRTSARARFFDYERNPAPRYDIRHTRRTPSDTAAADGSFVADIIETARTAAVRESNASTQTPRQADAAFASNAIDRPDADGFRFIGSVLGTFLIAEVGATLYFIDQHAAHERLLFDRLTSGENEAQELLIPYVIATESDDDERYLERIQGELAKIGFSARNAGGGRWEFTAIPARWTGTESDLAQMLLGERASADKVMYRIAAMTACKAAVKDGFVLDAATAADLAKQALALPDPHCPHGRPVWTTMTREQLFARVRRTEQ